MAPRLTGACITTPATVMFSNWDTSLIHSLDKKTKEGEKGAGEYNKDCYNPVKDARKVHLCGYQQIWN